MTYIAYLDEFGHVGPLARQDPRHNDRPDPLVGAAN